MKKLLVVCMCLAGVLALSGCVFNLNGGDGTVVFINDRSIEITYIQFVSTDDGEIDSMKYMDDDRRCEFDAAPGYYELRIFTQGGTRYCTPEFYLSSGQTKKWYFSDSDIK